MRIGAITSAEAQRLADEAAAITLQADKLLAQYWCVFARACGPCVPHDVGVHRMENTSYINREEGAGEDGRGRAARASCPRIT